MLEHNIELFQKNTVAGEPVTITQGNSLDLSAFESNTYEITLLLGPMYHLFTMEDQLKALSEAIRVTKKGGILFAAYCMGMQVFSLMVLFVGKSTLSSRIAA